MVPNTQLMQECSKLPIVKRLEMFPRLASEDPLTQLGGLAITQGERWQCGQALGPSSLGGSTLSYPLELQICYHYANV